jgi:hypothetical protein
MLVVPGCLLMRSMCWVLLLLLLGRLLLVQPQPPFVTPAASHLIERWRLPAPNLLFRLDELL